MGKVIDFVAYKLQREKELEEIFLKATREELLDLFSGDLDLGEMTEQEGHTYHLNNFSITFDQDLFDG